MNSSRLITAGQVVNEIRHQILSDGNGIVNTRDLLREIRGEIAEVSNATNPEPLENAATNLQTAREIQHVLWERPVVGRLPRLKRFVYKLMFFIFHRQFYLNQHLISAIEGIVIHLRSEQGTQVKKLDQLQNQVDRLIAMQTAEVPLYGLALDPVLALPSTFARAEKLILYSLIFSLKPGRVLEFATHDAPAGNVISYALANNGFGELVTMQTSEESTDMIMEVISPRWKLIRGSHPDWLAEANEMAGGTFDMMLFDSVHTHTEIRSYLEVLLPRLTDQAVILVHHANYSPVQSAMREIVNLASSQFVDCGLLSAGSGGNQQLGGLRLIRYTRNLSLS